MEFQVGWNWPDFQQYYRGLDDLHAYYKRAVDDVKFGDVGNTEERLVKANPAHLIIWLVETVPVGHAIWHETSTDEHRPNDARDAADRTLLRKFFGGKQEGLVELHELWLQTEHRRMGYGKLFFGFFENFMRRRGVRGIIHYSEHPAVKAICRRRGYKEGYLKDQGWAVFGLSL
jgi:GNAT superfamily N-acetyltransferase